ncbi:MAG: hypothetical protein AVDCRST_MAG68-5513 [uncultured Gemmatimonadetes bacterium]|uniref:Amidohydrolase-related domain-containing protein n=1 Tax=uncultured Gemmatimonadota bacterium TaxID=203437 RepID=A0A6J4MZZ4_9BACT|nr:MAG: hypothetical protein AVDCRST_MAG68-5513 [uncultured Gemmatimonadota bacterium]
MITLIENGEVYTPEPGVTHFHVGEMDRRLEPLRQILDEHDIDPRCVYPTHVQRNDKLMAEAVELTRRGCNVDVDTIEEDLAKWLRFYLDRGGDPACLTASSDASVSSPRVLSEQVRACVTEHGFMLEQVLPLVTRNTARILKLEKKGTLEKGKWGDILLLEKGTLDIVHVISKGVFMVRDGKPAVEEKFLEESKACDSPGRRQVPRRRVTHRDWRSDEDEAAFFGPGAGGDDGRGGMRRRRGGG